MPATNVGIAAEMTRRTVMETGAAAVAVSGCGVLGSASDERREISRAAPGAANRRLSLVLCRNAAGFYHAALVGQVRFPENSLYSLAIAIELSLKGYLLHRGVSDDWNRSHIRRDLRKALACARFAGFHRVPGGLADLAARLTPCYERHAIGRQAPEIRFPQLVPQACDTVRSLLLGVTGQVHQETTNCVWTAHLRFEGGHA